MIPLFSLYFLLKIIPNTTDTASIPKDRTAVP